MRNIFMRWMWRLYLRSGTAKVVVFLSTSFFIATLLIHSQNGFQKTSEVNLIRVEGDDDPTKQSGLELLEQWNVPSPEVLEVHGDSIREPPNDWLTIQDANRDVFVYASYLDERKSVRLVRIIAIVKKHKKLVECEIRVGNTTRRVKAKSKAIRENWNMLYSATFIMCEISSDIGVPQSVAVVYNGKVDLSSSVPVQVFSTRQHHGNMSVCVKPFHFKFNRAVWLVEFVEFYQLLGANHFIFYNHTLGPDVQKVLEYYQNEGIVSVLPWTLPVKSQKEIRTEGIFAALNDCNLRSISRFDFTAHVDVDEFLIPRGYPRVTDLISDLGQYNCYVFHNVFYYLYWENDTRIHDAMFDQEPSSNLGITLFGNESQVPYLLTMYKTRRLSTPHKPYKRSKYIVRPQNVVEVGNHNIWEYVGSKSEVTVPISKGLSQHYRICEFGGYDCLKDKNEIDRSAHRWMVPLMKGVAERCKNIFPSLERCPVAPPLGSPW